MIVKMTILRLLGSSDDKEKEKIGIARPEVSLWAPDEPTGQKGASVHWASYVPETMSSAQEKFLQHRFNQRCIGVWHQCNDVSAQEKILKHRMNR